MLKRLILFSLLLGVTVASSAQVPDTALFNKLGNFDMATLNGDSYSALLIGEQILPDTSKLSTGSRINFYAKLAKTYDEAEQGDKAIFYYEKVASAVPGYFVVQRALGLLYNAKAEDVQLLLYITPNTDPAYTTLYERYISAVRKTLPLLEKAQACDPDDDTLDLIHTLYQNIGDDAGYNKFTQRIPDLAAKCVDLLEDK